MNIAMIFAGGRGVRMGSGIPKQFLEIHGKPVLVHTLELFQEHDMIDKIYISVLEDYIGKTQKLVDRYGLDKVVSIIPGGATAQDSIYNVLKDAEKENDGDSIVLLHDGDCVRLYPMIRSNRTLKVYRSTVVRSPAQLATRQSYSARAVRK